MDRLRRIAGSHRRAMVDVAVLVVACLAITAVWLAVRDDPRSQPVQPALADAPAPAGRCVAQPAGGRLIRVEDGRAPVLLHVPPGEPPRSGRWPLVLHLPGAGQDGPFAESYTGYSALADAEGFLVAYPTASGRSPFWNVSGDQAGKPDDVAYLRRVIHALTGPPVCADPDRVTVTGASNGGGMSAVMACAAADLLAAAAPVAGGYSTLPRCRSRRRLPLLEIHSLTDPVVPYDGRGPRHAGAVRTFLRGWLRRNGCTGSPRRRRPADGLEELRWRCTAGSPVIHEIVRSAPHGWYGGPSQDPSSTTVRTWRFLSAFRRRP